MSSSTDPPIVRRIRTQLSRELAWSARAPADESTWARVRLEVNDALFAFWRKGKLVGDTPEQAFFVRCDRTTMTQNDIDNGRLVVLVGIAIVTPAEFVVIRMTKPGSS